jgi:hypothetical protein
MVKRKDTLILEPAPNQEFAEHGRTDVIRWDVFSISDGEVLRLRFDSVNSDWRQGVWLRTDRSIIVGSQDYEQVVLWQDTAPPVVELTCSSKDGLLDVYNVWCSGRPHTRMESHSASSGMLIEELPNGRRYQCNDIGFETQFDKLVFRLERTAQQVHPDHSAKKLKI